MSLDSRERHFFSSLVTKQKAEALGSEVDRQSITRAASFPGKDTMDRPRFQANVSSNRWYIAIPNLVNAVAYEELTGG